MGEIEQLTLPSASSPRTKNSEKKEKKEGKNRKKSLVRFSIHPLFALLGIYYCFINELPMYLMSALVALQHECAHAFAARRRGYVLNRVVLMPYGAVIDGDLTGINVADEIAVAVAGPLCNFLTAAGFVALWWFYPSAYAFTDTACYLSLSIALVNLIPAYPLDGGRVLKCALKPAVGEKKAEKICRGLSLAIAALLLCAFILLCTKNGFGAKSNFTLLLFAVFIGAGALGNSPSSAANYGKINFSCAAAFKRGTEVKRVAIDENCSLLRAVGFLCADKYLVLDVYDGEEKLLGEIGQNRLSEIFAENDIYRSVGEFL